MTDTTNTTAVLDADETMRQAVERFRTRMEAANRKFIQDRVDEIEAKGLATEEEKLFEIRGYRGLSDLGIGGVPGFCSPNVRPEVVREVYRLRQVTRLAEVPTVNHHLMDGVELSLGWHTNARQQLYLETVQQVCQARAEEAARDLDDDEEPVGVIPPCDELARFLRHVSSVRDMDLRWSGIAPFDPGFHLVVWRGGDDHTDDDEALERLRDGLRECLEEAEINKAIILGNIGNDLEVMTGFVTGEGYATGEYPQWYSAYVYCRRWVEDDDLRHRDWAWRVVFFGASIENPTALYGRYPRFDSIPEFLDWYSSWPDYVDMDRLRRVIGELESDDSDCELDD